MPKSTLIDFMAPGFAQQIDRLDREVLILVYCRSGNRSAAAVSVLKSNGFKHAYNLVGGYSSWKAVQQSPA